MQKLPLGIQDFATIRTENMVYVDKTQWLYQLVTEARYYFLSRPRRFGKSLLVSTLRYLFEGRADLFEGLWLANHSDWAWQAHPVIIFDFNVIAHDKPENLQLGLIKVLQRTAEIYQVQLSNTLAADLFEELIIALHTKTGQPVVVLVDEYDKPLIEHLGKGEAGLQIAQTQRDILRQLFGVLKGATTAPLLRFVLLTGVSRFSRISIFSELNNLYDLSMAEKYADMLGYTQTELENYFTPHLEQLAQKLKLTLPSLLQLLAYHYNGYRFSEAKATVYNPYSMLSAFMAQAIKNFWFETGTPTFLINLLKENRFELPMLDKLELDAMSFSHFDLNHLKPEPLLFQTGYLTIKQVDDELYTLGYPNYEVKQSFNRMLFAAWAEVTQGQIHSTILKLNRLLSEEKLPQFFEAMQTIFASIPSDIQLKQNEGYYHTIFYLMLAASGSQARSSILTAQGRIDLAVFFKDKAYIFEFKCNQSAQQALDQIKAQKYTWPYRDDYAKITLIGINFSLEKRNLAEWLVEVDQ